MPNADCFAEGLFWVGLLLAVLGGGVLICHGIGLLWIKFSEWIFGKIFEG